MFAEDEAKRIQRGPGPWTFSPVINALVSNSYHWRRYNLGEWTDVLSVCEDMITNLYANGFKIVKVSSKNS